MRLFNLQRLQQQHQQHQQRQQHQQHQQRRELLKRAAAVDFTHVALSGEGRRPPSQTARLGSAALEVDVLAGSVSMVTSPTDPPPTVSKREGVFN